MKKIAALFFVFVGILGTSAISEQRYKIPAENFDGAKLMERYSLDVDDFHAEYVDGEMFIVVRDDVSIVANPTFEASDTTKRDRLGVLHAKMGRLEDFTVSEINEYLRLTAGL